MNKIKMSAAALGVALLAIPASAQVNANNLVNVNLSDIVIQDIANDLNVNVSDIPLTVQVPIGIAANVCNVSANVLATENAVTGAPCKAENSSRALAQAVGRQMG